MMTKRARIFLYFLIIAAVAAPAAAQNSQGTTTRLLVGYAPGGPVDLTARRLAPFLQKDLDQIVIVDNRPGAGGLVALQQLANAAPNGLTLLLVADPTQTIAPHLQKDLSFDPLNDFTAIGGVVESTLALLVNKDLPIQSMSDFVAYARANPGKVTFGSAGVGSGNHLAGELLAQMTGASMLHVPYKGNAPAMTDVITGKLTFMFGAAGSAASFVKSGQLRALAVTSRIRNRTLPDAPTMIEAGLPRLGVTNWYALEAPPRLAPALVTRLNTALRNSLADPELARQLTGMGYEVAPSSPEALRSRITAEYELWRGVIKGLNIEQ